VFVGGEEEAWGRRGRVLEERRRKEWLFSKATRKIRLETLKCFYSREKKHFSHTKRHIADLNS